MSPSAFVNYFHVHSITGKKICCLLKGCGIQMPLFSQFSFYQSSNFLNWQPQVCNPATVVDWQLVSCGLWLLMHDSWSKHAFMQVISMHLTSTKTILYLELHLSEFSKHRLVTRTHFSMRTHVIKRLIHRQYYKERMKRWVIWAKCYLIGIFFFFLLLK